MRWKFDPCLDNVDDWLSRVSHSPWFDIKKIISTQIEVARAGF